MTLGKGLHCFDSGDLLIDSDWKGEHMLTADKSAQVDLMTITEVARALEATRGAAHYYRLCGRLPAIVVEGRYLIPREAVEKLQRERAAITARSKAAVN
jgi:hypothetical protein